MAPPSTATATAAWSPSLEAELARVLGQACWRVFLPGGTMAQQAVLRVHADRRQRRTIVFHPMCHLEQHEGQAHRRLQKDLTGFGPAGDPDRLLSLADLAPIAERVAALLIELPQRDLGGQQPSLDDLSAQAAWARGTGAAVHLDGARLWESAAGLRSAARGDRGALRHRVCLFLQGPRRAARLLRGRAAGCHRRGTGVAAPDGRHAVRLVAERRIRADPPDPAGCRSAPGYLVHARAIAAALADCSLGVRGGPRPAPGTR